MTKSTGLGDNFYYHGRNLSGDVGSLGTIGGGPALLETTAIDKSAMERLGGIRSGTVEFSSFFDDSTTSGSEGEHEILKQLPTNDRILCYFRGTTLGNPAAALTSKQVNYDFTRGADGSLTVAVQATSNAYGIEWGRSLTAGVRTDTGATAASSSTSIDTTASASFGGQAYLQVFGPFTGTDATVKIQDSADNSSFSDVASFAFTQITAARSAERIALSNTATIRRYVSVATTTSAGFTALSFAVVLIKNEIAGQVF